MPNNVKSRENLPCPEDIYRQAVGQVERDSSLCVKYSKAISCLIERGLKPLGISRWLSKRGVKIDAPTVKSYFADQFQASQSDTQKNANNGGAVK